MKRTSRCCAKKGCLCPSRAAAPNTPRCRPREDQRNLEVLPPDLEVDEIVAVYLAHKLMPAEALGDAHHLALAAYHRCDMLVTWNCKHIANANKPDQIGTTSTTDEVFNLTKIDRWFLVQINQILDFEEGLRASKNRLAQVNSKHC